tara:strand:- start:13019 stop:13900 length:882 start_codon:yes stop_codon:yes gene_type:complete
MLAASLPRTLPDARIRYAEESPVQFADLRMPKTTPPPSGFPVVVFVHGGGWLSDWTKDYSTPFVERLTEAGFVTWDIEFRRMGNRNGGYPETFCDVGKATDYLREVAKSYPLDLNKIVGMGHSTGGHLALWLAGRRNLQPGDPLFVPNSLPLKGVISIGGVNDLEHSLEFGGRTDILQLLGAESAVIASQLFAFTSPARLLPFRIPQVLILGSLEDSWRKDMTYAYAETARQSGETVKLVEPEGMDHFDVVDPLSSALPLIAQEVRAMSSTIERTTTQSQGRNKSNAFHLPPN